MSEDADTPGFYEAVVAHPDGETTPARYARTAAEYGFDGVVVRNADAVDGDVGTADLDAVREATGVDVVRGVTVRADGPSQASGYVGNYRPKTTLLLLAGGSPALNRFAVEEERVDVLTRPMAGRGDFNHVLANAAAEHGVRVEFDLSRVLRRSGGRRVQALQDLRKLRELVVACDAPFVVSGTPESHLQVRAHRELVAVAETVGFDAETVREGLREWGRLAARNRERQSEAFIEPGVRRGRHEETD